MVQLAPMTSASGSLLRNRLKASSPVTSVFAPVRALEGSGAEFGKWYADGGVEAGSFIECVLQGLSGPRTGGGKRRRRVRRARAGNRVFRFWRCVRRSGRRCGRRGG